MNYSLYDDLKLIKRDMVDELTKIEEKLMQQNSRKQSVAIRSPLDT